MEVEMSERKKNKIEVIGDRLLEVIHDHRDDKAPTLRMIAAVLWALDLRAEIALTPVEEKEPKRCSHCGAKEGELHVEGCPAIGSVIP